MTARLRVLRHLIGTTIHRNYRNNDDQYDYSDKDSTGDGQGMHNIWCHGGRIAYPAKSDKELRLGCFTE